jgi:sigma-E factor negative regulatory protein RseA
MNIKANESFSAFLDGEASELDVQRMLKELDNNPDVLGQWHSLSKVKAVTQGEVPVDVAPQVASVELTAEPPAGSPKSWRVRLMQGSMAAAVALVVVGSFNVMQQSQTPEIPVVQVDVPVQTDKTQLAEQQLEAQERLEFYVREHAEQASFTSGHVVVPAEFDWQEVEGE